MTRPAAAPAPAPAPDPEVWILDDDSGLRGALEALLVSAGYAARQFETAAAVLAAARPPGPACLLLDVRLRAESGLDLHERMAREGTGMPVILMSAFGDIPMTVRAMRAGAVDFLEKPFRDEALLSAVQAAVRRDAEAAALRAEAAALARRHETLSEREREVMALVAAGLMNKQIAGRLGLSVATVKIHRGAAMRKMAAPSLADLVRAAEILGVRDPALGRHAT
ncbi:response regulator transcription factor [Albimonas pacifica]|uniref:Two component transcriptional regulator, LuxR family n=1 Tax=Albimonas pacifica TaxID=1114924 RepID=A0A1I3BP67_9RHOB|nr:response regulator [Albimonas pacifica]SFH64062.1 two component transcriptional regulator, LuxR family [Albimonas pacifica]